MAGSKFRRALGWAFVLNWGRQGAAAVITFLLASLLGPHAFGTIALAQVYILFAELFLEQGLSATLIQRKNLDRGHLDTAFWLVIGLAMLLWGGSVAIAPLWARANELPELTVVIWALSFMLPLRALTVVQQALLQRDMDFRSLALRTNVAVWVGGGIGIGLALAGAGVWALVAQQLGGAAVGLVLLWRLSEWRPRLRFERRALGDLIGFSSAVLLTRMGLFASRRAEVVVIGIMFTPAAAGLYRLTQRLMELPVELSGRSMQAVSLPEFSRSQDDLQGLGRSVERAIWIAALLALPALATLAATGPDLLALLGDEWTDAGQALQWLCIVGAVSGLTMLNGPLLQARGRPHQNAVLAWTWGALTIGSSWLVATWVHDAPVGTQVAGIAGVRAGVALLIQFPVHLAFMSHNSGLPLRRFASAWAPSAVSAAAAYGAVAAARVAIPLEALQPALRVALLGALAGLAAAVVLLALDHRVRALVGGLLGARSPEPAPVPGDGR